MLRSCTLAFAAVCAVATVSAQTPSQDRPAPDRPAVEQPAAQQPTPAAAQPSPAPPALATQAPDPSKMTLTGCLKPGSTAGSWTLETAALPTAGASSPSGPVGTSGTASAKKTYNLSTKPADDLKPHANHKVEVTGTVNPPSAMGASTGASDAAARATFNVESFKMVSASCQ